MDTQINIIHFHFIITTFNFHLFNLHNYTIYHTKI